MSLIKYTVTSVCIDIFLYEDMQYLRQVICSLENKLYTKPKKCLMLSKFYFIFGIISRSL